MEVPKQTDLWANGELYESYVGRWSRVVAREFLDWLAIPAGGRWLDVGCGTGALSETILQCASPANVVGIDSSLQFVEHARAHVTDARARFEAGDARALPVDSATFDAVVSGLVLNFVPEPEMAVAELARAARPDGTVAVYVWDYSGDMQIMRHFWDSAVALDPAGSEVDESRRFAGLCRPDALADLFRGAGLAKVEARGIVVATTFRDFSDYWTPFLGGQGPAPRYAMSLSAERRNALREHIRARLPVEPDGSIALRARAWAVRGQR